MITTKHNIQIKTYSAYAYISSFILTRGVFLIYLASVGLSVFEISIYQSTYFISTSILEIPTGYIGDKIGKKKSILIGTILLGFHALLMYINKLFFVFLILSIIEALAYSFISGSEGALLYEILKDLKLEEHYLEINNKILSGRSISTGISLILGSYLADFSWAYVYIPVAFIFFISSIPLLILKESNISFNKCNNNSNIINKLKKELLYPTVTAFVIFILFSSGLDGLFVCFYNFNQIILPKFNMPIKYIGIFFSMLYFINSFAYILVNKLITLLNRKHIFIIFVYLQSIFFIIMSSNSNLVIIVIISALICFSSEIIFSVSDSIIQQYISSDHRATILSGVSLIRSLISSILYIILGYSFNTIQLKTTFIFIGLLIFSGISVGVIVWLTIFKKTI